MDAVIKEVLDGLKSVDALCEFRNRCDAYGKRSCSGDAVNHAMTKCYVFIEDNEASFKDKLSWILSHLSNLLVEKNEAYGDSFAKASGILELLYPDGVPVSKYSDMLAIVRTVDKLFRIATDKDALGESPWEDVAGYALLALIKDLAKKRKKE
jgi:hypothetical protein